MQQPEKLSGNLNRAGRKPGRPNLTTAQIREVITKFAGHNSNKLTRWLTEIEQQDGPKAALEAYCRVIEFALPKQRQIELSATTQVNILAVLTQARQRVIDAGIAAPALDHADTSDNVYYVKQREALEAELSTPYDPTEFEPGPDEQAE